MNLSSRSALAAMLFSVVAGATALTPTTAQAQVGADIDPETRQLLTTLFLGTTASTSIYLIQALTDRLLDKAFADAHHYMQENAHALQHDVNMGAGPALADLATLYEIPHDERAAWGAHLRARRAALVPLLCGEEMTRAQAQQFTLAALTSPQLARITR